LHTEATHHVFWNMSDRGIPRSFRTMEGFGVHTFRLVDAEGGTRLGGPNFTQLPINCPHAAVNGNLRDGMHQSVVHRGIAAYLPNSLGGEESPRAAAETEGGYVELPRPIEGVRIRANPVSFDDHFSQATLFYASMSPIERVHLIEAFTFELGKVYEQAIRERALEVLANVDAGLCVQVAAGLGLPAPAGKPADGVQPSPALSQIVTVPGPITGRVIGIVAAPGADLAGIGKVRKALAAQGAFVRVIAPVGGVLKKGAASEIIERTLLTTRSVEYDAILVAGGTGGLADIKLSVLLQEAFRHAKVLGAWGDGEQTLRAAGIDTTAPGVLIGDSVVAAYTKDLIAAVGLHRVWDRTPLVMASA
jgi:catalase